MNNLFGGRHLGCRIHKIRFITVSHGFISARATKSLFARLVQDELSGGAAYDALGATIHGEGQVLVSANEAAGSEHAAFWVDAKTWAATK